MKLITAVVKPDIADDVVTAATEAGARGMTASEVIGFGQQYGHGGPAAVSSTRCSARTAPATMTALRRVQLIAR